MKAGGLKLKNVYRNESTRPFYIIKKDGLLATKAAGFYSVPFTGSSSTLGCLMRIGLSTSTGSSVTSSPIS